MSVTEAIYETLQIIYSFIPKELFIVILGCFILYGFLEYGDRKNKQCQVKENKKSKKD
jgi:hypothetical protein